MKSSHWVPLLGFILVCVVGLQVYMLMGTASNYYEGNPKHVGRLKSLRALNATLTRLKADLEEQIVAKRDGHGQWGDRRGIGGSEGRSDRAQEAPQSASSASQGGARSSVNTRLPPSSSSSSSSSSPPLLKRAVLFTMDSMSGYEADSKKGGASGEIMIRTCLAAAFKVLNVQLTVITSDEAFNNVDAGKFDIIIMDPWTWAAPGWVPKRNIRGHEHKMYILDFFGSAKVKGSLKVSPERVLTAFGSPWNTALGYFLDIHEFETSQNMHSDRARQGVIWGKDPKHFSKLDKLLRGIASTVPLVATARRKVFEAHGIEWRGHQTRQSWLRLLTQSQFMIGMGNPLLGPSAIDAIACGAVYINPIYSSPMRDIFKSQHDYAAEKIGEPMVCSYPEGDVEAAMACVKKAIDPAREARIAIPEWFQWPNYVARVKEIFDL